MEKKDLIKLINEEITKFDFLGNDENLKEEENYDLLKNEDFQKQFICDSLVNNGKIKRDITDANVGGDWDNTEASKLTIRYYVNITYAYDPSKQPVRFTVDFESENIGIGVDSTYEPGTREIPPSGDASYNYIEWSDINVALFTLDGDSIEFIAFQNAPPKIRDLFIREYTEDFIASETIDTSRVKRDNIRSVPYC